MKPDTESVTDSDPITLARVLLGELMAIGWSGPMPTQPNPKLGDVFELLHKANRKALCFSGGGIRSATFGLGIAQKLAERGLLSKFDYLSTVSGGGYLGSWMSAWTRRERLKAAAKFDAVAEISSPEWERLGIGRVVGLSDSQLAAIYLLSSSSSQIQTLTDLRNVAKSFTPTTEQAGLLSLAEFRGLERLKSSGLSETQFEVLAKLSAAERSALKNDPKFRDVGIGSVEEQINCIPIEGSGRPTPEPVQLRHLREYSNYMSPKTGLLSADSWTLIAIYLRNLFLNLTIFIPLIAAALMLPRFLFLAIAPGKTADQGSGTDSFWVQVGVIAFGAIAFAFVFKMLPSKQGPAVSVGDPKTRTFFRKVRLFLNTDSGVLLFGILPLVAATLLVTSLAAWNGPKELRVLLGGAVLAFGIGVVVFIVLNKFRGFDLYEAAAAFLTSVFGGAVLWFVSQRLLAPRIWAGALPLSLQPYQWQLYISLAVPILLSIALISAAIYVGLSSRQATDEDREWLARYGGWVLIVSCLWIVVSLLVLIGPSLLQSLFRPLFNEELGRIKWNEIFTLNALTAKLSALIAVLSGAVSLFGGFSEKSLVRDEPAKSNVSKLLPYALQIAAVIFLGFILVGIAWLTTLLVFYLGAMAEPNIGHAAVLAGSYPGGLFLILLSLFGVGFFMACFVNVNKFSLHGAYRDRLVRAYLGASNHKRNQNTFTGFDDSDNLELQYLAGQRPFHVINATVNLVGGKNLAWQNRKAASFTMSPLHCGSWAVRGYRYSKDYCVSHTTKKALRLGTAMAISGAAANPNMGYFSSPVVTFLMSIFNIRLGWWLGNTGPAGSNFHWFGAGRRRFFEKVGPSIAVFPLINETLGRTDEEKHFLNVTDGGHFENLGLYEMILRRCTLIVLSDGAADEKFKFGEISNAIQKCKVDLGVDIKFNKGIKMVSRDADADGRKEAVRYALAEITYPEKVNGAHLTGTLLYTRPAYYGENEYTDIKYYAQANTKFPHQSTGDQMYDEKQFEAYRGLGFFTMEQIIDQSQDKGLSDFLTALKT